MSAIVRGTTPTIQYTFSTVDLTDLASAVLTISQRETVITLDLDDAAVDAAHGVLSWTLTQEDSLKLSPARTADIRLDWLLTNGTRGAGKTLQVSVSNPGVNEVMT